MLSSRLVSAGGAVLPGVGSLDRSAAPVGGAADSSGINIANTVFVGDAWVLGRLQPVSNRASVRVTEVIFNVDLTIFHREDCYDLILRIEPP